MRLWHFGVCLILRVEHLTAWSCTLSARALPPMSLERRLDSLPPFALAIALFAHCVLYSIALLWLTHFCHVVCLEFLLCLHTNLSIRGLIRCIHRVHNLRPLMAHWRLKFFACWAHICLVVHTLCSRLTTHEPRKAIGFPAIFALAFDLVAHCALYLIDYYGWPIFATSTI